MIAPAATHLRRGVVLAGIAAAVTLSPAPGLATTEERLDFSVRGKTMTISVYRAAQSRPQGTVFVGSGDVGWVGLAVDVAEYLSDRGYTVIGINARQYLAAFTSGKETLTTAEPPGDYHALFKFLDARRLVTRPVMVAGVSEGAALAVLAGASPQNRDWVSGVLTMGLPATAELAWRWSDFTSWITKKDAKEPMFMPGDFLPAVAPLPLCMIQSKKDEYVTEAEYRTFERIAVEPKRLVLIDASNHRFTDRRKELRQELLGCLAWMGEHQPMK